jgi:hypothetical protein
VGFRYWSYAASSIGEHERGLSIAVGQRHGGEQLQRLVVGLIEDRPVERHRHQPELTCSVEATVVSCTKGG